MNTILHKELSYKINGLFFKIHNTLGRFCREKQYADALEKLLIQENIPYKREKELSVSAESPSQGNRADFVIDDAVIVDLKAKKFITKEDYYQMQRYLRTVRYKLGMIVNFRNTYLKPKRVINTDTNLRMNVNDANKKGKENSLHSYDRHVPDSYHSHRHAGFGIVEIIIAMAIFVIMAATAGTIVLHTFSAGRLGNEESDASFQAQEGIEAARSIKNRSYANLIAGTYGLVTTSGYWEFGPTPTPGGKFSRTVTVATVQRLANDIVTSGGIVDSDTMKVTSSVAWSFTPARNNTVSFSTYLTNFRRAISGNWASPSQEASINLSGTTDGIKIQTAGNYAYMVRNTGTANFIVFDITNPASPTTAATINLGGTPTNIAISGNYAYVTRLDDASEFQVVNITNPLAPTITGMGTLNLTGNENAVGVYAVGTTVYVSSISGTRELAIINAANPAAPALLGAANLSNSANEVYVSGNYAYVADNADAEELIVINVSIPATPVQVANLNLGGTANGLSIDGYGNTVLVGRVGGGLSLINVTTPTSPSFIIAFNAAGNVNDISIGNNGNYAFLATTNGTAEFQVVNITTLSSPTLLGSVNLNPSPLGVAYSSTKDRAVLASSDNSNEFIIIKPL